MRPSFLSRRSFLGISNALLLLLVVFFLVPFALRGARLSLEKTENNVKDWLPKDFRETAEQEWFSHYFPGERFIVATWPGCTADDQRLRILAQKLEAETASAPIDGPLQETRERARQTGIRLGLLQGPSDYEDWLGLDEKWLASEAGRWYYITPDGKLYRWEGPAGVAGAVQRAAARLMGNTDELSRFVAAFSSPAPEQLDSPFYTNTHLLCAPLFATVATGPEVAEELARPDGPLWPRDATRRSLKPTIARRQAMERLSGTLFGPAVPPDFGWTPEEFADEIPAGRRDALPEDYRGIVQATLQARLVESFGGELSELIHSGPDEKAEVWYSVYDALRVEPPPRQTAVLVTLTSLGERNLNQVVGRGVRGRARGRVYQLADQAGLGTPRPPSSVPPPLDLLLDAPEAKEPRLRVGGPPVANVSIDEEGAITLARLVGYSLLTGLLLSFACFRSVKVTIMVFFVSGIAACASLSMVWWLGDSNDAVMMSMPPLVYVLSLSGAIHIINYYREEVQQRGLEGAPERAFLHGWAPCALAATTTAIGLMSLYTSNIIPIRKFGFYSAVGVLIAVCLLFAYLPSALQVFVPRARRFTPQQRLNRSRLERQWQEVGRWIVAHHRLVSVACLILVLASAAAVVRIRTSVQLLELFDRDAQVIRDYNWLENNFGDLVPMELVLRVPPRMQQENAATKESQQPPIGVGGGTPLALSMLERVEAVEHVQQTVDAIFGAEGSGVIGHAMSPIAFLPPTPPPANGFSPVRSQMNRSLIEARDELLGSEYLRIEQDGPWAGSELWRIHLRVGALKNIDYGIFVGDLRKAVEPVMQAYRGRQEILTRVNDQLEPNEYGTVIVLGRGKPADIAQELKNAEEMSLPQKRAAIFSTVLSDTLAGAPLRSVLWHDPTGGALAGRGRDAAWGNVLATADCVVLVDEHADYDLPFIQEHARSYLDARPLISTVTEPAIVGGVPSPIDPGPLQMVYTGVVPVVYKAQRTLLNSLVHSIGWAFVLIGGVMALLLNPGRGFRKLLPINIAYGTSAGAVSMLPNLFPVAIIFGSMGALGVAVDIGTMMTASVAMGVAVDDTIHFLTWFRDGLARGLSRHDSIINAYRRVGPAMTETTVVGGLGLFVFALSTFTPTQRFGTLMLLLLAAALVGDLIFLPAILAGPLGRLFRPKSQPQVSRLQGAGDEEAEQSARLFPPQPPHRHTRTHTGHTGPTSTSAG